MRVMVPPVLTIGELTAAISAGFATGVLVWFMGYGVSAAMEALKAASSLPGDE